MSDISRSQLGVATYLTPSGSLNNTTSVDNLKQALEQCISSRERQIVLDFSRVSLINSLALECLLDVYEQLMPMGGELKITQANSVITDVMALTGISNRILLIEGLEQKKVNVVSSIRPTSNKRLGELLLEKGLITEDVITQIVNIQEKNGGKMGHILQEKGFVSEHDMLEVLSEQLGKPFIRLRTGLYDPDTTTLLDNKMARAKMVVPLFSVRNILYLATAEPQDIPTLDAIEEITGKKVSPVLATRSDIAGIVADDYSDDHNLAEYIGVLDSENDLEIIEQKQSDDFVAIDEMASGSPVINLINGLIQRAVRDGASDIHIEPLRNHCQIRFRIDGVLYPAMSPPIDIHPALVSRLKVMANLDISERRMPQDGRIQIYTHGRTIDLRFSSLPGLLGEKIVLRVLDKNESVTNIEKLGMSDEVLDAYKRLLHKSHGLILVTGPTGSGKTTTLYAALNYLNTPEKSIVTIEDPVEYQLDMINQNQVKEGIGLDFSTVLKHILRQDPDIIMVGEIRDKDTAEIAVQAALTGHLVLATLHTNDSVGAITRMLDIGVETFLLSSALIGVFAQRLVRTICPSCQTSYVAPAGSLSRFGVRDGGQIRLSRGRGCEDCYDSGYKGRIAIHEVLEPDEDLKRQMVLDPSHDLLSRISKKSGFKTLLDDGLSRAISGETTIEEVSRVVGV